MRTLAGRSLVMTTTLMIVGVDLVSVESIRDSIAAFGDSFLRRIFAPGEIEYCQARASALESFAARFAAKEAVIKALRASEAGIDWRSIEVVNAADGACDLRLSGTAAAVARARSVAALALSLSHSAGYAIAFVVGRRQQGEIENGRFDP